MNGCSFWPTKREPTMVLKHLKNSKTVIKQVASYDTHKPPVPVQNPFKLTQTRLWHPSILIPRLIYWKLLFENPWSHCPFQFSMIHGFTEVLQDNIPIMSVSFHFFFRLNSEVLKKWHNSRSVKLKRKSSIVIQNSDSASNFRPSLFFSCTESRLISSDLSIIILQ